MDPDYTPNRTDLIRAPEKLTTIRETSLAMDDLYAKLIEVPHGKLGRIIHQFDDVDACLFSIDLASYDRYHGEDNQYNVLETSIRLFKGICMSAFLNAKPILLVFVNTSTFRRKLTTCPLSIHFPGYKGGVDGDTSMAFLVRRCKRATAPHQELFVHFAEDDAEDVSTVQFFQKRISRVPATAYVMKALGWQTGPASTVRYSDSSRAVFRPRLLSAHTV